VEPVARALVSGLKSLPVMPRGGKVWRGDDSLQGSCRQLSYATRLRGRLVGSVGLALITIVALFAPAASADVNSDQAQVSQLERQIARDGAAVQQLVGIYNQAQAHEDAIQTQLDTIHARLLADQNAKAKATADLRKAVLQRYMSSSDASSTLALFDTGKSSLVAQEAYSQIATRSLSNEIDAVAVDAQHTQSAEADLRTAQTQAHATLQQVTAARQAAQTALDKDNALLDQVQGNLQSLLAAAAQQAAAAQKQAEQRMTAQAASPRPVSVSFNPSPGTYADPLRAIAALSPERVDQGVDYSGYGPIYAIGDGVVLSTANSGWPGGTFISYRLTDGPAAGLVVYAAEDIEPLTTVGQSVTAGTVIGTVYEGPSGIETGWADPSGDGVTMAYDAGQFSGSNSTAFGANFSQLLSSLGAPPGILQNDPATGNLPGGWPTW